MYHDVSILVGKEESQRLLSRVEVSGAEAARYDQSAAGAYEAYFRGVIEEGIKQGVFHVQDVGVAKMFVFSALNQTYRSSAQIALNCSNVSWHALQV